MQWVLPWITTALDRWMRTHGRVSEPVHCNVLPAHAVKCDGELPTLRSGHVAGLVTILPLMDVERIVLRAVYNQTYNNAQLTH